MVYILIYQVPNFMFYIHSRGSCRCWSLCETMLRLGGVQPVQLALRCKQPTNTWRWFITHGPAPTLVLSICELILFSATKMACRTRSDRSGFSAPQQGIKEGRIQWFSEKPFGISWCFLAPKTMESVLNGNSKQPFVHSEYQSKQISTTLWYWWFWNKNI